MSDASASAHISVSNVAVDFGGKYGRVRILSGVNLEVRRGGFASLIGPSGCGKSTLLKILSGLLTPSEGVVSVAGLRPQQAVLEKRVGLVFQEATLMPWKTARQNVCLLMELSDRARSRGEINDRAEEMLRLVGLGHAMDRYPNQLSGGMRQRVSIARALALDPEVLLMDEPFGALDAITREEMCSFILEIWERTGKTIVLVTIRSTRRCFCPSRSTSWRPDRTDSRKPRCPGSLSAHRRQLHRPGLHRGFEPSPPPAQGQPCEDGRPMKRVMLLSQALSQTLRPCCSRSPF